MGAASLRRSARFVTRARAPGNGARASMRSVSGPCTLAKRHGSAGARSVGGLGGPFEAPHVLDRQAIDRGMQDVGDRAALAGHHHQIQLDELASVLLEYRTDATARGQRVAY